jgi:hypothetical protein
MESLFAGSKGAFFDGYTIFLWQVLGIKNRMMGGLTK